MSDAEAVRYDRQIRLWGKSTQQQLMHTNVVVDDVAGVAAEAAKNLVLAGVRAVAVVNAAAVTEADVTSNYLMQGEPGSTRAARALRSLHRLNPYVRVCATPAELGKGGAAVRLLAINSVDDGSAHVRAEEQDEQDSAAVAASPSDLLVLHTTLGSTVVAFVLYRRLATSGSLSLSEQWRRLVADSALLSAKPAGYQRLVLALHLRNAGASRRSFAEAAAAAYDVVDRLRLQQLSVADVEAVLCASAGAAADCVCATVAGACIAQHLIRQIGALAEPLDAQAHRWLLCSTGSEVECLVGM